MDPICFRIFIDVLKNNAVPDIVDLISETHDQQWRKCKENS